MKKIFNYLIAIALVLFQFLPVASAATITINKSVKGQTYSAYKIFDVTRNGNSYAYSIDSENNEWFTVVEAYASTETFTLTQVGSTSKYVVTFASGFNTTEKAKAFAEYLDGRKAGKVATKAVTATGTTTTIEGLDAGYYFVDSSLGALCILHTTTETLTIDEKNAEPTIKKEASQTSASVGKTVTFTVTITAGGNADTSYILHDKMSAGLTLNADSFAITVDGTAVESQNYGINYTPNDGDTFDITFNQSYTSSLTKNTKIVVTYTATVNEKAIIESADENEAKLQYGNTTSTSSTTTINNYDFELVKKDGNGKQLTGAQFKLYNAQTGGNEIKLILVTENGETFYRPAKADETAVDYIEAGSVQIKGLASGTYYLEEIKAPDGYNQLTERVAVNLNNTDLLGESAIKVVNTTGSLLPSTGGMGTVLFIVIGSIMVLGFGVLLVTKLRMTKMAL